MAHTIHLDIVTPEKTSYSADVESVTIPGEAGEVGVLPGHMPLVVALKAGEMRFEKDGETHYLAVSGGYAEVEPKKIVVLAETAELAEEIDVAKAKEKATAKGEQLKAVQMNADQVSQVQASLIKELVRLKVADKMKMKRKG